MSIFQNLSIFLLLLLPLSLQACKKSTNYIPEYKVKEGDTLISISTQQGCRYQMIARWNNIKAPYKIIVGQRLKFVNNPLKPSPKVSSTLSPIQPVKLKKYTGTFINYIVKKNDTLYSISRHFGVNSHRVATSNNLSALNQVNIGQKLKIPNTKQKHTKQKHSKQKHTKQKHSKQKHSKVTSTNNSIIINKNLRFNSQKNPIISNDNKNMLKFYCQWPLKGKILKTFTKTGRRGIEISGYRGQKVKAIAAGKVVAVNASIYGHGKFVVIKHNNHYMSSYANNQRTLVKRGQTIKQGQVIAELGKIGYKSPLLKFEIRKVGKLINPMYFLPKR